MKYSGYFKNRPELSKEEIDKSRDFDNLLRQLENGAGSPESQSEAPKAGDGNATGTVVGIKSWLMVAAGLAASLALVWIFMNQGRDIPPVAVQESDTVQFAAVNPPLQGVDIPWTIATIDPSKDTVLQVGKALIHVPAGAIVREDGSAPGENVDLKYREFMDVMDIFISGIPMAYDSAGSSFTFESAGMFELRAALGEEALRIADGRNVQVDLASTWEGSQFNQYRLNEETGQWEFLGADRETLPDSSENAELATNVEIPQGAPVSQSSQPVEFLEESINAVEKELSALEASAPVAPAKADPRKQTITISADVKHFPELAPYKGFRFEVLDLDNFDPRQSGKEWNDIKVLRGEKKGEFLLRFWKPGDQYDVLVKPVLSEEDHANAMVTYDKLFDEYEAGVKKKEDELRRQKEEYERQQQEYKRQLEVERLEREKREEAERIRQENFTQEQARLWKEGEAQRKAWEAQAQLRGDVLRAFTVARFGFYNSDTPCMLPKGIETMVQPVAQQNGTPISTNLVYLVETSRNAIYTIYQGSKLSFNPSQRNIAWTITSDGKLAVADAKEFANVDAKKDSCEMKFKVFEKQPKTAEEVKQLLSPYVQI